jgi:hypothetical protein
LPGANALNASAPETLVASWRWFRLHQPLAVITGNCTPAACAGMAACRLMA